MQIIMYKIPTKIVIIMTTESLRAGVVVEGPTVLQGSEEDGCIGQAMVTRRHYSE